MRLILFLTLLLSAICSQAAPNTVRVLTIDGAIGPASADYFIQALETAQHEKDALVVLELDTPGGLDTAMRDMIKSIIGSSVPVVTYVSPSGARAASAGTYLLYASHVAAMAPGTNLGAATPVQIASVQSLVTEEEAEQSSETPTTTNEEATKEATNEEKDDTDNTKKATDNDTTASDKDQDGDKETDTMKRKIVNDAEAYIRSLAQMHGRNVEWASKAVLESASLSAQDALEENVIDIVASDLDDLFEQINGREVKIQNDQQTLNTENLIIERQAPDWRQQILAIITNPNVAYILMLMGIYGLFFEFANPGSVIPGVVGAIALVMALFAFQALPINYAGVALILLGLAFIVAEAFMPSFGIVGIGGVVAFILGSLMLMDTEIPELKISRPLIITFGVVSGALLLFVLQAALRVHRRPVVSGREAMLNSMAECIDNGNETVRVHLNGEVWQARSRTPLQVGQTVKVVGIDGLILLVEPTIEPTLDA